LNCNVNAPNKSITTALDQIIPLSRITKLIIEFRCSSFVQLIELLCLTPNIHILKLGFMSIDEREYTPIEQSQCFQYIYL